MIPGINSDVRYGNCVYHVQTQDLGAERCILESLVYVGGQVLDTVLGSYKDVDPAASQAIRKRLIIQHRAVIASVNGGKYTDPAVALPATASVPLERPDLVVTEIEECLVGDRSSLMFVLRSETSFQPIAGAQIELFYPPNADPANCIYSATTDRRGFHLAEFRIPYVTSPEPCLLVRATAPAGEVESRLRVVPPADGSYRSESSEASSAYHASMAGETGRERERPSLVVLELDKLQAGGTASFLFLLQEEGSQRPIAEASLRVRLRGVGAVDQTLYEGSTDAKGFHVAQFSIPSTGGSKASLLIQATCDLGMAEVISPLTG